MDFLLVVIVLTISFFVVRAAWKHRNVRAPIRRYVMAQSEGLERAIVKVARGKNGIVSPAVVVAHYSQWGMDEVQVMLDDMVSRGHAEQRATESGSPPLVYVVPEFLTDATRRQIAGY